MRGFILAAATALLAFAFAALAPAFAQSGADASHSPPPCSSANPCASVFMQNGLYGVRNAAGEVTITPRFRLAEQAASRIPGAHGLILTYDENDRMGFVGRDGREIAPPRFSPPSTGRGAIFVSVAGAQNSSCAFDMLGRQILPCEFTSIFSSDRGFMAMRNGAQVWFDRTGARLPQAAPASAQQSAARAAPPAPAYNRARALADTRNWDDALNAVLNGAPEDQAYVLVAIYRVAAPSDTRYWPMLSVLSRNKSIFDSAQRGATPEQRRHIAALQTNFDNYEIRRAQGYGPAQSSGRTISARTVGECHSGGGSVSVMGYCRY